MIKPHAKKSALYKSGRVGLKCKPLTSDELLLQPWFLSKRVQLAIRSLVPPDYHRKMRDFFDDYGCMICGSEEDYEANGMCVRCNQNVRYMLASSARRRLKSTLARRIDMGLLRQARLAKKLLQKTTPMGRAALRRSRACAIRPSNPVDEMLGSFSVDRIPKGGRRPTTGDDTA